MKSFNKFMFLAFTLTVLIAAPYLNVSAMEMKDSIMKKDQMMKMDHMDSPHKQMKMGVADHDMQCKDDADKVSHNKQVGILYGVQGTIHFS